MLATQITVTFIESNFTDYHELDPFIIHFKENWQDFLKQSVSGNLIEDIKFRLWNIEDQKKVMRFYSKDYELVKKFQLALLDSEIFQTVVNEVKDKGWDIAVETIPAASADLIMFDYLEKITEQE